MPITIAYQITLRTIDFVVFHLISNRPTQLHPKMTNCPSLKHPPVGPWKPLVDVHFFMQVVEQLLITVNSWLFPR